MFRLFRTVAPTGTEQHFERLFFGKYLATSRFFVITDREGEVSALFASYFQVASIAGRPEYLYNSLLIVHPDYRGKSLFAASFLVQFRAFGWLALRKGGYWISFLINPISYHGVASTCPVAYPRYDLPLTETAAEIIRTVDKDRHFHLVRVGNIYKGKGAVAPHYPPEQVHRIRTSDKPNIRFFLDHDVDFLSGEGIPVVVPYTIPNILGTVLRALSKTMRVRWRSN